jgi:hypothetical protein
MDTGRNETARPFDGDPPEVTDTKGIWLGVRQPCKVEVVMMLVQEFEKAVVVRSAK